MAKTHRIAWINSEIADFMRPVTPLTSIMGSGTWETHRVDLSRAWMDTGGVFSAENEQYLHAPFCHYEDGWEEFGNLDTVTRIYSKIKVGDEIKRKDYGPLVVTHVNVKKLVVGGVEEWWWLYKVEAKK
jgi:hypothetical protein